MEAEQIWRGRARCDESADEEEKGGATRSWAGLRGVGRGTAEKWWKVWNRELAGERCLSAQRAGRVRADGGAGPKRQEGTGSEVPA